VLKGDKSDDRTSTIAREVASEEPLLLLLLLLLHETQNTAAPAANETNTKERARAPAGVLTPSTLFGFVIVL